MINSGNSKKFSVTEIHHMSVTRQELRLEKQARAPGGGCVCRAKASELCPVSSGLQTGMHIPKGTHNKIHWGKT